MMKYCFILLFLVVSFWFAPPAFSSIVCRNYDGHEICILKIKRSAKKYWEYRASVSIDGKKKPLEIYNCRGGFKINKDGSVEQFTENSPGEMICSFFDK